MRYRFLPVILISLLASCSSAYKTTQTPDDVYYSPGKPVKAYSEDRYENYTSSEDRYLRMRAHNYNRWATIDDFEYWNDSRYDFGLMCTPSRTAFMSSFYLNYPAFNPYFSYGIYYSPLGYSPWGAWYNPRYTIVYYNNPKVFTGATSKSNLSSFLNNNYNNNNYNYNNQNKSSFGGLLQKVFSNSNNNSPSFNNNSTFRTFNSNTTPSNNAGGRSGGFNSSGSSAGGSRPSRPH